MLGKSNYHLPNSDTLSNFLGKVYEKMIQQEAINVLTENNFYMCLPLWKNVFAY